MKKINFLAKTVFGLILMGFMACSSPQSHEHSHEKNQEVAQETPAVSTKASVELLANVLQNYLLLKDHLVASNAEQAQKSASQMLDSLKNAPQDEESIKILQDNLSQISQNTDLEKQRIAFELVSDQLYALLKSSNAHKATIYKQYCPMAFNDKGAAWISDKPEIRNPYFGDQMLKCGEVKETLEVK